MSQVKNFIENSQTLNENYSECNNIFMNDPIQRYCSLESIFSSGLNNNQYNQLFNDQYNQTELLQYTSEYNYPLLKSNQCEEQFLDMQHQQCYYNNNQYGNLIDADFMKYTPFSQEQQFIYGTQQQQEVIKKEEIDSNNDQESQNDDNLSSTHSNQSTIPQNELFNSLNKNSSQMSVKTEENTQFVIQQQISSSAPCKKQQKQPKVPKSQNASLEKSKQSISKNNIRNFLTPIVRMRSQFIDYTLLKNEDVSTQEFDSFLKKHFFVPGQSKLNIRQTTFDSLLDTQDKTQLKEKKVFAQIVIKNIQNQFMKLIIEKNTTFSHQEFNQQFEWINGINESLIIFLNSLQNQN